jgi:hypothetical protein
LLPADFVALTTRQIKSVTGLLLSWLSELALAPGNVAPAAFVAEAVLPHAHPRDALLAAGPLVRQLCSAAALVRAAPAAELVRLAQAVAATVTWAALQEAMASSATAEQAMAIVRPVLSLEGAQAIPEEGAGSDAESSAQAAELHARLRCDPPPDRDPSNWLLCWHGRRLD